MLWIISLLREVLRARRLARPGPKLLLLLLPVAERRSLAN